MSDAGLVAQISAAHGLAQLGGGSGGETFYCQCGVVTRGTDEEGFLAPHLLHLAAVTAKAVRDQIAGEIESAQWEQGSQERPLEGEDQGAWVAGANAGVRFAVNIAAGEVSS